MQALRGTHVSRGLRSRAEGAGCRPEIIRSLASTSRIGYRGMEGRDHWAAPIETARELPMTYVVTDNCIKCKYMDCVEVCPVDCFYEGENMLVIHPDECIDCGVCEPECPAEAIFPDNVPGLEKWLQLNADFAPKWPNITMKREPPA